MCRHLSQPVFEPILSPLYWPAELFMNIWWILTSLYNFRSNQGECLKPLYFQIFLCFLFVWKQRKLEPKIILFCGLKNIAILYSGADGKRHGLLLRVSVLFHKSCESAVTPSSCLRLAIWTPESLESGLSPKCPCAHSSYPCRQPEIWDTVSPHPPTTQNSQCILTLWFPINLHLQRLSMLLLV